MRSYPSVVRLFNAGALNSSLRVPEPSYMLEITYLMHIGFFGKGYRKIRRLSHLSTEPCSAKFFQKLNNLMDSLTFE